ncbi:DUF2513 domain-containing protein [Peptostreptococcus sp. D1]|uniref:DUF2513 domain-containing protein n=1 Tax=Peptostreptococcus sp. D1 TaxID=72304 RepID=UPI0008E36234|nr:DUF2513 domain-containing protein [Peptostreptococcus sp. D1]SFE88535.1 Hypothetical protein SAMN02910278_01968 [Peptostreptococcus sp. D1]
MKLNPDCMRDILIFAENIEYGTQSTLTKLSEALPQYSIEELDYSSGKLYEAGFIDATFLPKQRHIGDVLSKLNGLTYDGHQLLANIRNEKIWEPTKSIAKEIGATSIQALTQIATGVVTQIITKHLGY